MPPALSDDEMSGSDSGPDNVPAKGKIPTKEEEMAEAEDDDDEEDAEEEYRVESIKGHRFAGGQLLYQVKWLGYEKAADMTWEPIENLDNAAEAVTTYHNNIGGPPEPSAKKKGGKRSASAAFDTPASGKKTKSSRQSEAPTNGTPGKKQLPQGLWEHDVQRVSSILDEGASEKDAGLIGLLEWQDGAKTQHPMQVLRRKCPQKLLDYYEQHLVFRNDAPVEEV